MDQSQQKEGQEVHYFFLHSFLSAAREAAGALYQGWGQLLGNLYEMAQDELAKTLAEKALQSQPG